MAVGLGLVLAAAPALTSPPLAGARASLQSPDEGTVTGGAERLRGSAKPLLGLNRYACVGVRRTPDAEARPTGLELLLISRSKETRGLARRAIRQADVGAYTRVRVVSRRYGEAAQMRIYNYLTRVGPDDAVMHLVGGDDPSRCGFVRITLFGSASDQSRQWAHAAQQHFGADRVEVRFAAPGQPVPL